MNTSKLTRLRATVGYRVLAEQTLVATPASLLSESEMLEYLLTDRLEEAASFLHIVSLDEDEDFEEEEFDDDYQEDDFDEEEDFDDEEEDFDDEESDEEEDDF